MTLKEKQEKLVKDLRTWVDDAPNRCPSGLFFIDLDEAEILVKLLDERGVDKFEERLRICQEALKAIRDREENNE